MITDAVPDLLVGVGDVVNGTSYVQMCLSEMWTMQKPVQDLDEVWIRDWGDQLLWGC